MTLAVLRPTPGKVVSSSVVEGTMPAKRSTRACAMPCRWRAFAFGYDTDLMYSYIASIVAFAMAWAVG